MTDDTDDSDPRRLPNTLTSLILTWRTVSIGLAVALLASLVTLIIAFPTRNSEVLTEVALSMAIITFVAQLVIFVAQLFLTSRQASRSEDLVHREGEVLSELRTMMQYVFDTARNSGSSGGTSAASATTGGDGAAAENTGAGAPTASNDLGGGTANAS